MSMPFTHPAMVVLSSRGKLLILPEQISFPSTLSYHLRGSGLCEQQIACLLRLRSE